VLPPSVAEVGRSYADKVDAVVVAALELLDQALRRGHSSPEAWRNAVQSIGDRLLVKQVLVASMADPYLNDVLEAQDADPSADASVQPVAFGDITDGGGSWLQALVFAPNSVRESDRDWVSRFDFVAQSIVKTGLTDTARSSVQTGMQARPSCEYYVRMLRGKSCARCALLAGRKYRSAIAFRRHKRCDCAHIPGPESIDDWSVDTKDYFNSLSTSDQDRLFTKAGAESIRLGADPAQVVNARSGIYVASSNGQQVQATTTGTTVRGLAGRRLDGEIRLLPDEIFLQAERLGWDRTEVQRQLQRFGYLL